MEDKLEPKNVQECVLTLCWACRGGANRDLMNRGGEGRRTHYRQSFLANRLVLPPLDRLTKH